MSITKNITTFVYNKQSINTMKKILCLLCTLLTISSVSAQKQLSIEVLGHRGGRHEVDENTLSAFQTSYKRGIRSFETDIRLTADNELLIIHDASLKRTCGVDVNVEKSTRAELATYKSLKGNPLLFADELAAFFASRDIYYIEWEMKSNNYEGEQLKLYCDKLYNTVMPSKPKGALYIFSSFDKRAITTMKSLHPDAECMFISSKPVSDELLNTAAELGVKRLGARLSSTSRKSMEKAHKQGYIINVWPGGSVEDFQLAVALGADIACTDYPNEVLKFVKKKMKWVTPYNSLELK